LTILIDNFRLKIGIKKEGNLHYNLLATTKKYLEDPSYYFEDYGGWIFGGV
jgi:hypothetical protein